MTEHSLTRRESLLGIGAAGTALGGGAFASNAFAGEEDEKDGEDEITDDEKTKDGLQLEFVCYEKTWAKFRVRNERAEGAKVNWKVDVDFDALKADLDDVDADIDDLDDLDEDDLDGTVLDLDEDDLDALDDYDLDDLDEDELDDLDDYDIDDLDEDDLDGTEFDLDDLRGKLTVPKGDSKTFRARVVPKYATVGLYHGGKKVDSADVSDRK